MYARNPWAQQRSSVSADSWTSVAVGTKNTIALRTDGTVWARTARALACAFGPDMLGGGVEGAAGGSAHTRGGGR